VAIFTIVAGVKNRAESGSRIFSSPARRSLAQEGNLRTAVLQAFGWSTRQPSPSQSRLDYTAVILKRKTRSVRDGRHWKRQRRGPAIARKEVNGCAMAAASITAQTIQEPCGEIAGARESIVQKRGARSDSATLRRSRADFHDGGSRRRSLAQWDQQGPLEGRTVFAFATSL